MTLNLIVIGIYMAVMIGIGFYSKRRATSEADFLVAGRRLGPVLYAGTMGALVMGGGATVGGIGLGWEFGLSGAWLVTAIGLGILLLSAFLAKRIVKLKVYTVTEMLDLRYGGDNGLISGIVMFLYTLMLTVTSTLAYATIFQVSPVGNSFTAGLDSQTAHILQQMAETATLHTPKAATASATSAP